MRVHALWAHVGEWQRLFYPVLCWRNERAVVMHGAVRGGGGGQTRRTGLHVPRPAAPAFRALPALNLPWVRTHVLPTVSVSGRLLHDVHRLQRRRRPCTQRQSKSALL